MTLIQTSIDSLRAQVLHLKADFAFWRSRTAEGGDLRQHRSQVERIADMLIGSLEEALHNTPVMDQAATLDNAHLARLPGLRRDIGSVHLVWEFFRDKFAQRDVESFESHLGCGDDLAWACYKPCLDAAIEAGVLNVEEVKEPPLVFYSTYRTPFAQARTKMFHPQGLDSKDIANFANVLINLPVPVIGIPWAIANRLPELVLVGHETGHVVAEDLGLANEARVALQDVAFSDDPNDSRKNAWLSWCDEVFADLFGVIATGRAFVAGLGAELAAGVAETRAVRIDLQDPGDYPTPTLRIALCEEALTQLRVTPSDAWRDVYSALSGDSRDFRNDVAPVVQALLLRQWDHLNGKRLTDVLPWNDIQETQAATVAHACLNEQPVNVPFDVRVWIAGAMMAAYRDPTAYAVLGLDESVARFIVGRRPDTVRFAHAARSRATFSLGLTEDQSEKKRKKRDREAGRRLYALLKSMH